MITAAYAQAMAAYNAEMNRRLYAAAAELSDEERRADRGVFWRSIHGTFSHLLWGDETWMSRFDGWAKPDTPIASSSEHVTDFAELSARRTDADRRILDWAARLDDPWLAGDLVWRRSSTNEEARRPRALLVAHFFNHQTHHRGQAHAMLTAAGRRTGETDLIAVI